MHGAIQAWLFGFSLLAIYLSQDWRIGYRRWACWVGLASQPAWLYTAWAAEQWGIFGLSLLYTAMWLRGVHTYWIKS